MFRGVAPHATPPILRPTQLTCCSINSCNENTKYLNTHTVGVVYVDCAISTLYAHMYSWLPGNVLAQLCPPVSSEVPSSYWGVVHHTVQQSPLSHWKSTCIYVLLLMSNRDRQIDRQTRCTVEETNESCYILNPNTHHQLRAYLLYWLFSPVK